jgi:hypothetical protein
MLITLAVYARWYPQNISSLTEGMTQLHNLFHPHPPVDKKTAPSGPGPTHCRGPAITLRHITLGRTPLDEWSAHRKDLYHTDITRSSKNNSGLILDFKLATYFECCILSFGWFSGVWILYAEVSEHSVCSIFIGGVSRKNNRSFFLLTPPTKMERVFRNVGT